MHSTAILEWIIATSTSVGNWIVENAELLFIWIPLYVIFAAISGGIMTFVFGNLYSPSKLTQILPDIVELVGVSFSGVVLLSVLMGAAYAYVELENEGKMPDVFNPASYEWTGSFGNPVTSLMALYSIGLILTVVSIFAHRDGSDEYLKGVMPWITMPVLAPIDLLAAFQSIYVLKHGFEWDRKYIKNPEYDLRGNVSEPFSVTKGTDDSYKKYSWSLSCDGEELYSGNIPYSQTLTLPSCASCKLSITKHSTP